MSQTPNSFESIKEKDTEEHEVARMVNEGGKDLPDKLRPREPVIVQVPTVLSMLHKQGIIK